MILWFLKGFTLHECIKVIGIGGYFLKGTCRGELLSIVGRDTNNYIYPLVWGIVNVENKRKWKWLLDHLMEDTERKWS